VRLFNNTAYIGIPGIGIGASDLTANIASAINQLFGISKVQASTLDGKIGASDAKVVKLTQVRGEAGNTTITSGNFSGIVTVVTEGFGAGAGPTDYSEVWSPTTGVIAAEGNIINDSYVLSPLRHGHFFDTVAAPVEKFYLSTIQKATPPIYTPLATSSYVLSSNTDNYSRIFGKFEDRD